MNEAKSLEVKESTTALISAIERAALNPNIDLDKMERLLAMQERIMAKNAEMAFNVSMTSAQSEMRPVAADAENPQTRSRYASYAALDKAIRSIYTNHGFALSFDTGEGAPTDWVRVICRVAHKDGHSVCYHADMPADGKGAKGGDVMTKTHAAGSAMSYGMRYLLKMIFNVAVGEDDDDGNRATLEYISDEQVANIEALLSEVGANRESFLRFIKCRKVEDILAKNYAKVVAVIEQKRKQQ